MSESDEKLSLILDAYPGNEESHAVLDEVIGDVNLQYQIRRYQMIGDVMRHELPDQINLDLGQQIMTEVQQIKASEASAGNTSKARITSSFWSWASLKPLAGFAVAASVAVVTVTIWQSVSTGTLPEQDDNQVVSIEQQKIEKLASQPIQGNAVTVSSNLGDGMRWKTDSDSPALQQKLNGYLVNHTEYSNPIQGLIPQARVAGYDSEQ